MSIDFKTFDKSRIVDMYVSGKSVTYISAHFGVSKPYTDKVLRDANVTRRPRSIFDRDAAVAMYLSGESENATALHFGVDRGVIARLLRKRGIQRRNQSEAETLKWSKMTDEQRANQVAKANEAIRNKPASFHKQLSIKQAITKEKTLAKVGVFEREFIKEFEKLGHVCAPQKAFDAYNIDIAIDDFAAVEIHCNSGNPHTIPYYRKRVMYLLERGWHVIYIKITRDPLVEVTAQQVSRMIDLIKSNKPAVCQYGMIRGSGDLVTSGSLDGDKLAIVNASDGFFTAIET